MFKAQVMLRFPPQNALATDKYDVTVSSCAYLDQNIYHVDCQNFS